MKKLLGLMLVLILCMAPAMAEAPAAEAPVAEAPVAAEATVVTAYDAGLELIASFRGGTGAEMSWLRYSDVLINDVDGLLTFVKADGTALSNRYFCEYDFAVDGYFAAHEADAEGQPMLWGVLSEDGREAVPFSYGAVEVFSGDWAIGTVMEIGTEKDYDEMELTLEGPVFYICSAYDVYDLNTGTKVGTLPRDTYEDAEAVGNCLNIEVRGGTVTCYGPGFEALGEVEYTFSEDLVPLEFQPSVSVNKEGFQYVMRNALTDEIARGDNPMAGDNVDGYVKIYRHNEDGVSRYGVATADGTVIVPMDYEEIMTFNGLYVYHGIAAARIGEVVDYYDENGVKLCSTTYSGPSYKGLSNVDLNGDVLTITAADGVVTTINGVTNAFAHLQGRYYAVTLVGATGAMLVDWHGTELFPIGQYEDFATSFGDEPCLLAIRYSGSGFDLYSISR